MSKKLMAILAINNIVLVWTIVRLNSEQAVLQSAVSGLYFRLSSLASAAFSAANDTAENAYWIEQIVQYLTR